MIADSTQWFAVASLVVLVACGGGGSTDAVNNTNNPTGTISPGAVGSIENPAPLALTAENSEQILLTAGAFGFSFNSAPPTTQSSAVTVVSSPLASFSKAGVSQSAPTQNIYNCGISGSFELRSSGPFGVGGIQAGDYYDVNYTDCKNRAFVSVANTTSSFSTSNGGFRYTWVTVTPDSGQPAASTVNENKIEYRNYTSLTEPENTAFSYDGIFNIKVTTNRAATEQKNTTSSSLKFDISTTIAQSSFAARYTNYAVIATVNEAPKGSFYEEIAVNYDVSYKSKLSLQPATVSPNIFYALKVSTEIPFRTRGFNGWGVTCPIAGSMTLTGANGSKIRLTVIDVDTTKIPSFSRWLLETDADGNGSYESRKTYECGQLLYAD
jgi:hypothetical protein